MIAGACSSTSERSPTFAMPRRTTFVLPGRNRSGGVRVTMEMGNRLMELGHSVRIVYRRPLLSLMWRGRVLAGSVIRRLRGAVHNDWLVNFRGPIECFDELSDLDFERDEIVIAVGSKAVPHVRKLTAPVTRVRFCHGFHNFLPERMAAAWAFAMPTLTVSRNLIPGLIAYDGSSPIWTVPNGINLDSYFDERRMRDGIGAIYAGSPAKCPQDTLLALEQIPRRVGARRYVFGENRRPRQLAMSEYWQLPSLEKARELYNRSKIWLLMSQAEGLLGPILEAMACGTAVVSSDNEGSREVIRHGENGLFFPIGDVRACAEAVERLWNDDELRARIVRGGMETARAFSWDRAVRSMQSALDDLITGRSRYADVSAVSPCS